MQRQEAIRRAGDIVDAMFIVWALAIVWRHGKEKRVPDDFHRRRSWTTSGFDDGTGGRSFVRSTGWAFVGSSRTDSFGFHFQNRHLQMTDDVTCDYMRCCSSTM